METKELYKMAMEKWGVDLQLIILIEEMSELTKEITKFLRVDYIDSRFNL